MATFEKTTCVRFQKRTFPKPFIFIKNQRGCSAFVGYNGHSHDTYLHAPQCTKRKGTILHEFLHTLGFHHEHSRPDRDDFVKVHWRNIVSGFEKNFLKLNNTEANFLSMGLPYDYFSVLHYSPYAFAKDHRHPTLTPTRPTQAVIGQRRGLSRTDVARVNRLCDCRNHYLGDDLPGAQNYIEWRLSIDNLKLSFLI
ncbi:low choriolytic enzyme-like [Oratosquilla oratoria]|uniref:low choriolytic enzyme-like n=1 Tax=Oratosquilla oratoria TaxID=337810 RepID=UPI003F7706F5